MPKPIINNQIVRKNPQLKAIQRNGKSIYKKGDHKVLKNYVGKLVKIDYHELIGEEAKVLKPVDKTSITKEMLLKKIEDAGLLGMSGNGFPVIEKLHTFMDATTDKKILIVNAVECEPGLKQDEWLLHNRLAEICEGIHYINHALQFNDSILAVKQDIKCSDKSVNVVKIPARFPMGEEHFMIHAVTGMMLEKDVIPASQGILVMNLQTVYQIFKLMNHNYEGKRFVTLADLETGKGKIAYISENDSVEEVIKSAFSKELQIFAGSGILKVDPISDNTTFGKLISFAAFSIEQDIRIDNKCKGCGQCTKKCPVGIPVHKVVQALEKDMNADISMYHPEKCILCGSCAYFCKAGKLPGAYVNYKRS